MIGEPINRIEGPLKVTGRATYAYEQQVAGQPLYGFILNATIARGSIKRIDTSAAENFPGVRLVMTHRNAPAQGVPDLANPWQYVRAAPVLDSPNIQEYGAPVALVVADTLEQARAGVKLIEVAYVPDPGCYDIAAAEAQAYAPKVANGFLATDTAVGNFESAFASAEVKLDVRYATSYMFSHPMEPNACLASWDGDDLTVRVSAQVVRFARAAIAATLAIDEQRVHVIVPFVGGGFGSKLGIHAETILAALAARQLKRPVKIALARQQIMHLVGSRPTSRQHVRLAAGRDGRLVALAHDVKMSTSPRLEYVEQIAATTRGLYAAPNRLTSHRMVPVNLPPSTDVRGPGEVPGLLAVESAMDELAYALKMDPVELRIINEPTVHPELGIPFSDRHLVECMREGAKRFGWDRRPVVPASLRDGQWMVGYGMAAAIRMHFQLPTKAGIRIESDGTAVVKTDLTEIGTGHITILTQVAAERLGLPIDRVRVDLGRSDLPPGFGSGGSWGAPSTSAALYRACDALQEKLSRADGKGATSEPIAQMAARLFPEGVEAEGEIIGMESDPNYKTNSMHTYGAQFVEVGVDADTGEIRLRRMLGVFSIGRILNRKTARSQVIGGMIWGLSSALHEEAVVDTRLGCFVNRDLAEYLVPVHADIPDLDAVLLDSFDSKANMLGAKGVGELGICGSGAAVANAVFNATGVRVREFPITVDKMLRGLAQADASSSTNGKP